jgi:Transposase DDE domain
LIRTIDAQLRQLSPATHGNRELQFYHVVVAHLIAFFNPLVASLRRIEDVAEYRVVRRHFGLRHLPKSTLSDAQRVFDPALLAPLVDELRGRLKPHIKDPRLDSLLRELLAVDGSFFAIAARVAWAIHGRSKPGDPRQNPGQLRLDLQLDVNRDVPAEATICGGHIGEQEQLLRRVRSGCLYLLDRGFQSFELLAAILAADSDFVVRWRKDMVYRPLTARPLSAADRLAGVVEDVEIGLDGYRARPLSSRILRLVKIHLPEADEPVLLVSNRLDLPAEMVGVLYRHRWQIELFFRWLKCTANFRHFLSESPAGITLQTYAAIIGTLLIALESQSPPSVYSFASMSMLMSGMVTLEEARRVIARREKIRTHDAQRQKQYNARRRLQKNV